MKKKIFGEKEYDFTLFFNSRNIRRKQIPDAIWAFRLFLDKLTPEQAQKCAFVLHTEPVSDHGTDLTAVVNYLLPDHKQNVYFSTDRLSTEGLNLLYNIADAQILLSSNEGWGLALTEAISSGTPIIANVQGGMQDQMRFENENGEWLDFTPDFPSNHRGTYTTCGEWAFPVFPSNISIQGSPKTPYISDDRCKPEDAADQIHAIYSLSPGERKRKGLAGREWALGEAGFTSEIMGQRVIDSFEQLFATWEPRETFELINATTHKPDTTRNTKLIY
jgi:glycosyltransferase involved in cell wall biosynthesis